jgi:hypothetical protein
MAYVGTAHEAKGLMDKEENGAPGEIRTPDLMVRSHALYPTELRAQFLTSSKLDAGLRPAASLALNVQPTRMWRRERDSNPRWAFDPYTLSRGAPSTTRPSLRGRPANRLSPLFETERACAPSKPAFGHLANANRLNSTSRPREGGQEYWRRGGR